MTHALKQRDGIARCPVCQSGNTTVAVRDAPFRIPALEKLVLLNFSVCNTCYFGYQDNPLTDDSLRYYYENKTLPRDISANDVEKSVYASQSRFIEDNFSISGKKLLEIGPGDGKFLEFMKKDKGAITYYNEYSAECVRILDAAGHLSDENGRDYQIVIACHTLEHIVNPLSFLEKIKGMILKTGILFIEVPDWSFSDTYTDIFNLEHVNHFSTSSLSVALARAGFAVLKTEVSRTEGYSTTSSRVLRALAKPRPTSTSPDQMVASHYQQSECRYARGIDRLISSLPDGGSLALYGASWLTEQVLRQSASINDIEFTIFDKDERKQSSGFFGFSVRNPHDISSFDPDVLVIMSSYEVEIRAFLNEIKFKGRVVSYRDFETES